MAKVSVSDFSTTFDFGFTFEDENDLVAPIKQQAEQAVETAESAQAKAQAMYESILPLLTNLKKNPESEIIRWPNRTERIDSFIEHLNNILNG